MDLQLEDYLIAWHDDPDRTFEATIAIGLTADMESEDFAYDERVFYYVPDRDYIEKLYNRDNGEDFFIVGVSHSI